MVFKKKFESSDDNNSESKSKENKYELTDELLYAVAEAVINRDNIIKAISKTIGCTESKAVQLQKEVLSSPRYKEVFEDYKAMLKSTVYEDDADTIMIQYNNLIRKATQEKKYEVVVRIIDKIRQLQAIGDKEMEFKVTFDFEPTDKVNLNLIKEKDNNVSE